MKREATVELLTQNTSQRWDSVFMRNDGKSRLPGSEEGQGERRREGPAARERVGSPEPCPLPTSLPIVPGKPRLAPRSAAFPSGRTWTLLPHPSGKPMEPPGPGRSLTGASRALPPAPAAAQMVTERTDRPLRPEVNGGALAMLRPTPPAAIGVSRSSWRATRLSERQSA